MRTKLSRSKNPQPTTLARPRSVKKMLRKYAPWAAVICAGIYLPPKLFSVNYSWLNDADGKWSDTTQWSPTGFPGSGGSTSDIATFNTDFSLSRTVTLDTNVSLISSTFTSGNVNAGSFVVNDPVPPNTLTVTASGTNSFLLSGTGSATIVKFSGTFDGVTPATNLPDDGLYQAGGFNFNIAENNVLQLNPASSGNSILSDAAAGANGTLVKTGTGTLSITGANTYTGPTYIADGVVQVVSLTNGGTAGNLGKAASDASNLIISTYSTAQNSSTLRYIGTSTDTTNRLFSIGPDQYVLDSATGTQVLDANNNPTLLAYGATLDGSGTAPIIFNNSGAIGFVGSGSTTLVLRGTLGGSGITAATNELDALITDPGGVDMHIAPTNGVYPQATTSLVKQDIGTWRITNANTYTGPTLLQRGTLQLDYTKGPQAADGAAGAVNQSRIPNGSAFTIGGLPGGATLELDGVSSVGGVLQNNEERVASFSVGQGSNVIQYSVATGQTNTPSLFIPDIANTETAGGTVRIGTVLPSATTTNTLNSVIFTDKANLGGTSGIFPAWLTIGDDFATGGMAIPASGPAGAATVHAGEIPIVAFGSTYLVPGGTAGYVAGTYTTYDGTNNSPGSWAPNDVIQVTATGQNQLAVIDAGASQSQSVPNLFSINAIKLQSNPAVNKLLQIADETIFNVSSGGVLMTSGSGQTVLQSTVNGGLTTSGGQLYFNTRQTGNNLYISTQILDFTDFTNGGAITHVGFSKSGPGALIFQNYATSGLDPFGNPVTNAGFEYQGAAYINEGLVIVRSDYALGEVNGFTNSANGDGTISETNIDDSKGQTNINGGLLEFQGVHYTHPEVVNIYQGLEVATVANGTNDNTANPIGTSIAANQGKSEFAGQIINQYREAQTTLNITGWLTLDGLSQEGTHTTQDTTLEGDNVAYALSGVAGFIKSGSGTLVVNGPVNILNNTSNVLSAGDLTLTAGNSIWNADVSLGSPGNTLTVTAGQHAFMAGLSTARIQNSGANFGLLGYGETYSGAYAQTAGTTFFASILQPAGMAIKQTGAINLQGGTLDFNGSITVTGSFAALNGTFSEIGNFANDFMPTVTFTPANGGIITFGTGGGSATLNVNTVFGAPNSSLQTTIGAITFLANGMGLTTFHTGISSIGAPINTLTGSGSTATTLTLTNALLDKQLILAGGVVNFNGLVTMSGLLSVNQLGLNGGQSFNEAGTRRSSSDNANTPHNVYGVRDVFNGGITIQNTTGAFNSTITPTFQGADLFSSSAPITFAGTAAGVTYAGQTTSSGNTRFTDSSFGNVDDFSGVVNITGGRIQLQTGDGLGTAAINFGTAGTQPVYAEKAIYELQRGAATPTGSNITVGPTTGYLTSIVVTNRGTGYSSANTAVLTGGGGSGVAIAAPTLNGTTIQSFTINNVGTGYTTAPMVTVAAGAGGSGFAATAVLSSVVALRGSDNGAALFGGNLVIDDVANNVVTAATPIISIASDREITIEGNITGGTTSVNNIAGTTRYRYLATATPGGVMNSGNGYFILDGQVRDTPTGASTVVTSQLSTEWGSTTGNNELNVWVNKQWDTNGLLTLADGVMRFTDPTDKQFFQTGNVTVNGVTIAGVTTPNFELSVANSNVTSVGWGASNTNAALFLTQTGQQFNAANFTVHNGNTDKFNGSAQSGGNITIGGENAGGTTGSTVTFGTGTGTITLETDGGATGLQTSQNRDLRLYANGTGDNGTSFGTTVGTVDIAANFTHSNTVATAATASITKVGDGTVRLLGSTATTPAQNVEKVFVTGGTLDLVYSTPTGSSGPLSTSRFLSTSTLTLGGGILQVDSSATTVSTNTDFQGGFTVNKGASAIVIGKTTGIATLTVDLAGTSTTKGSNSTFARNTGGLLRLDNTNSTHGIINLNPTNFSGVPTAVNNSTVFGFATFGTAASVNDANAALGFASFVGMTPALTVYMAGTTQANASLFTNGLANNYQEANTTSAGGGAASGFSGTITPASGNSFQLNTINFNSTTAGTSGTITIASGVTLEMQSGILVTSNASGTSAAAVGNAVQTITGGSLANANNLYSDLIIQNYSFSPLVIASKITDAVVNPAAGKSNLTLGGDGVIVLSNNSNDFGSFGTAGTTVFIDGATVQISDDHALGAAVITGTTTANTVAMEGGTLHVTADVTTGRLFQIYGDRSTLQVDAGHTLTLTNVITPEANNQTTTQGGNNTFDGDLNISGGGTVYQAFAPTSTINNSFTGQLFITGNSRYIYEGDVSSFLGTNYSAMDGTTIESGSTLELRPTILANNTGNSFYTTEWVTFSGAGQNGAGAIRMTRPTFATAGYSSTVDRPQVGFLGPVTMNGDGTIFVDDQPEVNSQTFSTTVNQPSYVANSTGTVGTFDIIDDVFDGGGHTLTKTGNGVLRIVNAKVENLPTIVVQQGEVRFDTGITGTVGYSAGLNVTVDTEGFSLANNYYTGTSSIIVSPLGANVSTAANTPFATNPRLYFNDVRGLNNVNITLDGGYLLAINTDGPLEPVMLGGNLSLIGSASSNAIEVSSANGNSRANPTIEFGSLLGDANSGITKLGNNELQLVGHSDQFGGTLVIARSGYSLSTPSVALYDNGTLNGIKAIQITNDGTFYIDDQHSLDASAAAADNPVGGRVNDNAEIDLSGTGKIRLIGTAIANSGSFEKVGNLVIQQGSDVIELDPGQQNGTTNSAIGMGFSSYTRTQGGVAQFRVIEDNSQFSTSNSLTTANNAFITIGSIPSAANYVGGGGSPGSTNMNVLVGAFGGAPTTSFQSLQGNTTLQSVFINNEDPFVTRQLMTIETVGGVNYLRPLTSSEYYTPTPLVTDSTVPAWQKASNIAVFDSSYTGTNDNVRLTGGFGPFSSTTAEVNFVTEGLYQLDDQSQSQKQFSDYQVKTDLTVNSLSFGATPVVTVAGGGNLVMLDIGAGKTVNITSGMLLDANYGVMSQTDPNTGDITDQRAFIRGGTLNFGSAEAIIENVSATEHEINGTWQQTTQGNTSIAPAASNNTNNVSFWDLEIYSTIAGTGGLTKSGLSDVTLAGANTYSGVTTVTEGALRLENSQALGHSDLVKLVGTGELHLGFGISVGTPNGGSSNPVLRFTDDSNATIGTVNLGTPSSSIVVPTSSTTPTQIFRNDGQYNSWYGDIQLDTAMSSGERLLNAAITMSSFSTLVLGGNIYGLDSTTGSILGLNADQAAVGTAPLNDNDRNRTSRLLMLQFDGSGGVIELKGSVSDTAPRMVNGVLTGAVALQSGFSQVNTGNEDQVLRVSISGSNRSNVVMYKPWDSAGSILLRQGALTLTPQAGMNFFTTTAMNEINTLNSQSRTVMGDVNVGNSDSALILTTAGQDFNAPTILAQNNTGDSTYTLAGLNNSGTVSFFKPVLEPDGVTMSFNDANQRVSNWDRNVRVYAAAGGTVEVDGKITDSVAGSTTSPGNGSITKVGPGTVVFKGMDMNTQGWTGANTGPVNNITTVASSVNDFDKQIVAAGGTLEFDYGNNIGNNVGGVLQNGWGSTTVSITLAGGNLVFIGNSSLPVQQTYGTGTTLGVNNGFEVHPGLSEIDLAPVGNAAATITLTLTGTFSQLTNSFAGMTAGGTVTAVTTAGGISPGTNGGTVNFVNPGGGSNIVFTAVASQIGSSGELTSNLGTAANAMLGPWATFGTSPGTVLDFASRDASNNLIAFSGYTVTADPSTPTLAGKMVSEAATGFNGNTAASGIKDIKLGANVASTLTLPNGFILGNGAATSTTLVSDEGGILIPTGISAAKTIAGGTLASAQSKDLIIQNYGTGGLTIKSIITNDTGGSGNLVVSGPGTTTLAPKDGSNNPVSNAYSGRTFVSGGTLSVDSVGGAVNELGADPVTSITGTALTATVSATSTTTTNTLSLTSIPAKLEVGQLVTGTNIPANTVITSIFTNGSTNTIQLSNTITTAVSSGTGLTFGVVPDSLSLEGGTFQFTGSTYTLDSDVPVSGGNLPVRIFSGSGVLSVNRGVTLGGDGGIFNVATPTAQDALQINGVIGAAGNAAVQAGNTTNGTLVSGGTYSSLARNPYVGDLTKTGQGILILNNVNTYSGITDIKQGTLELMTNSGQVLGSNTGVLDQTVIEAGATLRFAQQYGDLSTQEWIDVKPGASNAMLEAYYPAIVSNGAVVSSLGGQTIVSNGTVLTGQTIQQRDLILDGVINLEGNLEIKYTGDNIKVGLGTIASPYVTTLGSAAGGSNIVFGNTGGYITGSGSIIKDGVNNGAGGILTFSENNPEWTGGLVINGGRVIVRSMGTPLGTGNIPIQLGTTQKVTLNYNPTGAIGPAATATGEQVAPNAELFFAPENDVINAQGAQSSLGDFTNTPSVYQINQDIIVERPDDASNFRQVKRIGITTNTPPGLSGNGVSAFDQYNFNGNIILNDDLQLYVDGNSLLVPQGGQTINFNLNGNLVTGNPKAGTGNISTFLDTTGQTTLAGNITGQTTTLINISTGALNTGAIFARFNNSTPQGTYPAFFANFNLGGDNTNYSGTFTIGNVPLATGLIGQAVQVGDNDANHVLNVTAPRGLNNAGNDIIFYYDSTLRLNGNTSVMGGIRSGYFIVGTLTLTDENSDDPTLQTGAIFANDSTGNPINPQAGTTADLIYPMNNQGIYQASIHAIVENASTTAATLTVNQTTNSTWAELIRDGVTSSGAPSAPLTLVKQGPGIAEIRTPNIYSGGTVVNGGILQVDTPQGMVLYDQNNGDSGTGTGKVTIGHDGTLRGTGYVGGSVDVYGTVFAGRSAADGGTGTTGILSLGQTTLLSSRGSTMGNDVVGAVTTFMDGSTLLSDLRSPDDDPTGQTPFGISGSKHSQVITQSLALNGVVGIGVVLPVGGLGLDPADEDPFNLAGDAHFTILISENPFDLTNFAGFAGQGNITNFGGDISASYVDGLNPNQMDTQIFRIVEFDGGFDDGGNPVYAIQLIAIPEPGTVATLVSGLGMLLGLQRFRRGRRSQQE